MKTTNGKRGGNLVGKPHNDKSGKPVGGIKAVVTDAGGKPVELEGGEVIINKEASKKHWKELSRINQSAGNGVPISPPVDPHDEDPTDYEVGGKIIEFNRNHLPNKWILSYAKGIKKDHPEIWKLGGNIYGNTAFENLCRVSARGYWLDSEEWMYKKWQSFLARHQHDFRIAGVVAVLKWGGKVNKGWKYMKDLIEAKISKSKAKPKSMKTGGSVVTYKMKFNKKYGFESDESHSLAEIAKLTKLKISALQDIYDKGIGAYKTNPQSVRPNVKSKEQWAMARVYSAVMGGKAAKVDANELERGKKYADGGLIAPNGKKSNLTPEQYKLVRTPEFKAWFGDWENSPETASKVVDENGEPLVVFHGTTATFNTFKSENKGSRGGLNEKFWSFTTNVEQALVYALDKRLYGNFSEPRIIPVFLNIQEMPTYDNQGRFYRKLEVWGGYKYIDIFQLQDWHDRGFDMGVEFKKVDGFCVKNTTEMEDFGEVDKNKFVGDTYYVRNSNQIKLADGSNTTFDGGNDDIRYADGGSVGFENDLFKALSEHDAPSFKDGGEIRKGRDGQTIFDDVWLLTRNEYANENIVVHSGDSLKRNRHPLENYFQKSITDVQHKNRVQKAIDEGKYEKAIKSGILTTERANEIIKSADLDVKFKDGGEIEDAFENTKKLIEELKKHSFYEKGSVSISKDGRQRYRYDHYKLRYPNSSNWLVKLFEKAAEENTGKPYHTQFFHTDKYSFSYDRPKFRGLPNGRMSMSELILM